MRKILLTSIIALVLNTLCTSYDGERKLDGETNNVISTIWGGGTSSQKQFLDASHLDLVGATEIEIQLGEGNIALFNADTRVPPMIGFFHGHNEGQDANIYKDPDTGNVFGSIVDSVKNEVHQISTNAIGETEVVTRDGDDFTDEDVGTEMNVPASKVGFFGRLLDDFPRLRSSPLAQPRVLDNDDKIDIMVVWTKKAECKNSGLSSRCTPTAQTRQNMLGKITLAVDETNTAFALSGVGTQLRLVHAYLDDTYDEGNNQDSLMDVTFQHDGKLDTVHGNRTKFAADVVSFWVHDDGGGCGLAWVGPHKDYMFAVVHWDCATGHYSFGHELAHTMGCNHDRGTEGAWDDSHCTNQQQNYGYRDPSRRFRDIMSYSCKSGQCDNISPGSRSCARVQRFSNTVSNYEGAPIGNAQNDCASHLNANLATVKNYYEAMTDAKLIEEGNHLSRNNAPVPTPITPVPTPPAPAPGPSPTATDCKGYGGRCNSHAVCCNKCRWRRCT